MPVIQHAAKLDSGVAVAFDEGGQTTVIIGDDRIRVDFVAQRLLASGNTLAVVGDKAALIWRQGAKTYKEIELSQPTTLALESANRFVVEGLVQTRVYTANGEGHWLKSNQKLPKSPSLEALNRLNVVPVKIARFGEWTIAQTRAGRIVGIDQQGNIGIDLKTPEGKEQSFNLVGDKVVIARARPQQARPKYSVWALAGEKIADLPNGAQPMGRGAVKFEADGQLTIYPYHSMLTPKNVTLPFAAMQSVVGPNALFLIRDNELPPEIFEVDFGNTP